jgi:ParB-like chromosome segregation protein Spo0J
MTHRRPDLEAHLDDLGIPWTLEEVQVADVDRPSSRSQQYRIEVVNQPTVDQYAADMARGDTFPAIIARRVGAKLVLLGGMHRHAAALAAGVDRLWCYTVTASAAQGRRLSFEDNRRHGLTLTPGERAELAARMVELDGLTQKAAGELVGVDQMSVSVAISARKALARAKDAGIDLSAAGPAARARLNGLADDRLFIPAAHLVASKRMGTDPTVKLVTRLHAADSLEAALDEIDTMTAGYVRGNPGRGQRRHADEVGEGLEPRDVEIMSDRLKRAARHLMAIDKALPR